MQQQTVLTDLAADTYKGLSSKPKYLLSKYFYNKRGSKLFQKIMHMPEYYLTDCELEIIKNHKQAIFEAISGLDNAFDLIELGAGDGLKTKVLLAHFYEYQAPFRYVPIDISATAVRKLEEDIHALFPQMVIDGQIGDYFHLLDAMSKQSHIQKVLLFLGSNIGNMDRKQSIDFLKKLRSVMQGKDLLIIGFDLKKDPHIIKLAYNDPHGYTAAFNLNVLQRINDELQADFNLSRFSHIESYNPETGTAKSFLVSECEQKVQVSAIDETFDFEKGEAIYTEMSQKYDMDMILDLADHSGFEIVRNFTDHRQFFMNSIWKLKS